MLQAVEYPKGMGNDTIVTPIPLDAVVSCVSSLKLELFQSHLMAHRTPLTQAT